MYDDVFGPLFETEKCIQDFGYIVDNNCHVFGRDYKLLEVLIRIHKAYLVFPWIYDCLRLTFTTFSDRPMLLLCSFHPDSAIHLCSFSKIVKICFPSVLPCLSLPTALKLRLRAASVIATLTKNNPPAQV